MAEPVKKPVLRVRVGDAGDLLAAQSRFGVSPELANAIADLAFASRRGLL